MRLADRMSPVEVHAEPKFIDFLEDLHCRPSGQDEAVYADLKSSA